MKNKGITELKPAPDAPFSQMVDISKLIDRTEFILLLSQLMQKYNNKMDPDEKIATARWFSSIWNPE